LIPRFRNRNHAGLALGFRSGLEEKNAAHLKANGAPVLYESLLIPYIIPASWHTYTPDFPLSNGIIAETKGRWLAVDRAKMLFVKTQYPGLDIRLVFQRANTPISEGSKTTCAQWADKHGFKWAERLIPLEWLREPGPEERPEVVLRRGPMGLKELTTMVPYHRKRTA
jgi:hypothetical protein